MSTKAQEKVQGIPHGIFHLTTFCRVQIYGLVEVLEGVVSREESSSLARFFYKHLCPLPLGEPSLQQACLRMGMTSIPVGIPGGSQSSTQPRWLRAWWEQRLGTPSWMLLGIMGSHSGPWRACLLTALALASLLSSASFQHIPESIHPLNCLKCIEHQLFTRHLFHRGEQSKHRPAPMCFLFKIASG